MLLYHLANALKEETIRQIKHETGNDPYKITELLFHNESGTEPFALSFQVESFDHKGSHVYTITVVEAHTH